MRGDHYIISCFHIEVSQASYIQEEDITPLFSKMSWIEYLQSDCKINKFKLENHKRIDI